MNLTTNDLFAIIGNKEVEIIALRAQLAAAIRQIETLQPKQEASAPATE